MGIIGNQDKENTIAKVLLQLEEVKNLINDPPAAKKKNDYLAVSANVAQALGFFILFIAWYYQNIEGGKWQSLRNNQNLARSQTINMEISLDVLELGSALFVWYTQAGVKTTAAMDSVRLKTNNEYGQLLIAYRKNIVALHRMDEGAMSDLAFDQWLAGVRSDSVKMETFRKEKNIDSLEFFLKDYRFKIRTGKFDKFISSLNASARNADRLVKSAGGKYVSLYRAGTIILLIGFILQGKKSLNKMSVGHYAFWVLIFLSVIFVIWQYVK